MAPRPSVYVIEDSPIILDLLTQLIELTGASVVGHAESASAAIADISALHPDAVAIDISLARGNGLLVLEALAINEEGSGPLRIVLTNSVSDADRAAALELGAHHYFDKAKEIREFLTVISSLVSRAGGDGQMSRAA